MTAERLDVFWDVNARATILLTREFAALHAPGSGPVARPGERVGRRGSFSSPTGRVFWMTSGQIHGPMRGEVAYAVSRPGSPG